MHEQRAADAAGDPQADDATDARPEAAVLELPPLEVRKRKDACPYKHLGLPPPNIDFWELLQADLGRLTQELPGQIGAQ
jgi:hypothetical protein